MRCSTYFSSYTTFLPATMAPTSSTLFIHSLNHPSGRHLYHTRRQGLNFSHHPPRQFLLPHTEERTLGITVQPSVVLEDPPPPPVASTSSGSAVLVPEPSAIPTGSDQSMDIPGSIAAAVIVIVLVLGGLIGLMVGGEMLRRQARATGKHVSFPSSRYSGRRKSGLIKNANGSPQQPTQSAREKFPYDEKTLTPLTRPLPVLDRKRQRRLSDAWPIRRLSMAVYNRRSCPVQVERSLRHSLPMVSPQTTWSEFSPVLPYVAPPRAVLSCIPEELEECQSQSNSDIEAMLGVTLQRSVESGSVTSAAQTSEPKSSRDMLLKEPASAGAAERLGPLDCQTMYDRGRGDSDSDAKSLESSAPDMTPDRGESSRSSMTSLESLEDRESLREEVFELKRAQTRSMQMNKGVLLSLSLKILDDSKNSESGSTPGESSGSDAEGDKDCVVEREMSLAMLDGNFSSVNLDEFPSPPSILPLIPSFVSGF